ncbi:unnamed protein product [Victoria cruziana]
MKRAAPLEQSVDDRKTFKPENFQMFFNCRSSRPATDGNGAWFKIFFSLALTRVLEGIKHLIEPRTSSWSSVVVCLQANWRTPPYQQRVPSIGDQLAFNHQEGRVS